MLLDDGDATPSFCFATTTNTQNALALWALAEEARFVYASSAATYGALEAELSDEADLHALRPLNAYAYSKHLFDLYAARTGLDHRTCGLKYFNVFGPNEDHKGEMRSIVQKAYEQIREGGRVRLFKSYRPEYRDGRTAARLSLREGCRRDDASPRAIRCHRSLQRGIRHAAYVDRSSSGRSFTPSSCLSASSSSTCRRTFAESISTIPARAWRDSTRPDTSGRSRRLADAVTDYVTNYLVPQRPLELSDAPVAAPLKAMSP